MKTSGEWSDLVTRWRCELHAPAALSTARESHLPIRLFDFHELQSVKRLTTGWTVGDYIPYRNKFVPLDTQHKLIRRSTQVLCPWLRWHCPPGVTQLKCETGRSLISSDKLKRNTCVLGGHYGLCEVTHRGLQCVVLVFFYCSKLRGPSLWDITSCSPSTVNRRFKGSYLCKSSLMTS
jgi:hypothetical protein